jgi:hypothetical protein
MNYPVDHWKTGQLVTLDFCHDYLNEWVPPENFNAFMVIERSREQPDICITIYSFTTQLYHCIHHTYLREFKE